jgi:hypothetical protein
MICIWNSIYNLNITVFFFFFFFKKKKFKESEVAIKWCMVDLSLFLTNFFFFGGGNYGKVKIGDLCVVMFVSYSD